MLRFIETIPAGPYFWSHRAFTTYRNTDGTHVFFRCRDWGEDATEPLRPGIDADQMVEALQHYTLTWAEVEANLDQTDAEDEFFVCERTTCGEIHPNDERVTVNDTEEWCEDCTTNWSYTCTRCDNYHSEQNITSVGDDTACRDCSDNHAFYCESCDETVWEDDDYHYENHPSSESTYCCESPMPNFEVGIGQVRFASNTMHNVIDDSGMIDDNGVGKIRAVLNLWIASVSEEVTPPGLVWAKGINTWSYLNDAAYYAQRDAGEAYQTKDGKYVKRLRSALHKRLKNAEHLLAENLRRNFSQDEPSAAVTLPRPGAEVWAEIGDLARKHSEPLDLQIEFTRDVNVDAEEFFHGGSCWWTDYDYSRCTLKSNAGFGIRAWDVDGRLTGRAWAFPLVKQGDQWVPTFGDAEAYVVFNGYGSLDKFAASRILLPMAGAEHSVGVSLNGDMYVNGDAMFVGPETEEAIVIAGINDRHAVLPVPAMV